MRVTAGYDILLRLRRAVTRRDMTRRNPATRMKRFQVGEITK
ncbi:hypothetical protein C7S13_5444 [Burkholderia cepacia]|nr:hypothetical protein [Burkholderia cepacia]